MARLSFLGRARRSVIGLDVGSNAVRAAQVSFGGPKPVVQKLGQVALPPGTMTEGQALNPPALTAAVMELRKALGLRKAEVVLGCEQLRGTNRTAELPWVPQKLRQQALPLLASDILPTESGDASNLIVDFAEYSESTGDDGGRLMIGMVAVAYNEALLTQIAAIEAAGLRVSRVDLSGFGLVRSLASSLDREEPEAILDIGARTGLVVIHIGGRPQVVRMFPIPVESDVGRLIDEVNSSLRMLPDGRSRELTRIAVTGGSASAETVASLSREYETGGLPAPIEVESAFRNVELGDVQLGARQLQVMAATAAVCVGLALGEAA